MATSIFFNGRVISVPGAYSEVDASGLDTVSLGASGIVAVLGTSEGGRPVSTIDEAKDITRYTNAEKARRAFRGGQLREVAGMLFSPAKDPDIPGGAVEFVAMKVNPATQSLATLENGDGPAIDFTSRDYGAFTEQINIDLQDGTTKGKLITIIFEDITESQDDLGGDTLSKLQYLPGTNGYNTAVADVDSAGNITVTATRSGNGQDGLVDNPVGNTAVEIISSNAGDVGLTVELFGLVGGVPTVEILTSNGTVVEAGSAIWDAGYLPGVRVTGTLLGTLTVRTLGGAGVDVFTVPAGTDPSEGIIECENCYVNSTSLAFVSDGASTKKIIAFGRNKAGSAVNEAVDLTGTVSVPSVADTYGFLDVLVVGDMEAAQVLTVTAEAAKALASVQTNLVKAADYFNAKSTLVAPLTYEGFVWTITTGRTSFLLADLDPTSQNILGPADADFTADLALLLEWINQNSQLVSAAAASGATGVPDNTPSPVFMVGGAEGLAAFADYQKALNLLKKVRVNSIVDLSGDPAVAAALDSHCAYMGGIGRSERDGFVGVLNGAMTDVPTKDEYKSAIVDLNTRHLRATGQAVERYNSAGEKTEFLSPFLGAILAGAQGGSSVGTSLTHKYMNVLGFRQHSTWNPTDDAEEMINAGACFLEEVEGVGRRVKRNVTTHLSSNNIAFVEASVNEAVNFAVFNFRTNLEFIVGKKGFSGTVASTRSNAAATLGLLVDALVLTGWRNLDVELILDVMDVSCELAPVIPINFVRIVVHLVTLAQLQDG